jgi:hypothetical protein
MNNALKCLDEWCTGEGLSINPRKTIIVPFTRRRNLGGLANLTLSGVKTELRETVKYLGITLDQRMTWSKYLDIAIHKARWSLMVSRRMLGLKWGLKPHMCHWLYVAMVRPQVAYGAPVWWQKAQQTTARNKLVNLQRLACLCTAGPFRITPTAALEVLFGLLPLDLYIKAAARMAAYRITTANNWRGSYLRSGHSTIIDTVLCNSVLNVPSDCMYSKYMFKQPLGDSHARGIANELQYQLGYVFEVRGIVKPGASAESIVKSNVNLSTLTQDVFCIIWGGTRDVSKN